LPLDRRVAPTEGKRRSTGKHLNLQIVLDRFRWRDIASGEIVDNKTRVWRSVVKEEIDRDVGEHDAIDGTVGLQT
jgi:hypothetical protein